MDGDEREESCFPRLFLGGKHVTKRGTCGKGVLLPGFLPAAVNLMRSYEQRDLSGRGKVNTMDTRLAVSQRRRVGT